MKLSLKGVPVFGLTNILDLSQNSIFTMLHGMKKEFVLSLI